MGRQLSLREELDLAREQHPGSNVRPIFGGKAIEIDAPQQPIEGMAEAEARANERTRRHLGQSPLLGLELGA